MVTTGVKQWHLFRDYIKEQRPLIILLWVFLIYLFVAFTLRNIVWIAQASSDNRRLFDFKIFFEGALDFRAGGSLFHPSATLSFERINASNNLSPQGALIFLLLSYLPFMVAAVLWDGLTIALFWFALARYVFRVFPLPQQLHWKVAIFVLIYVSYPMSESIELAHWSLFIAFLDISVWYLARKGMDNWAGILLGLAVVLRWQPIPLVLLFLVLGRWKVVLYSAASAIVVSAVAALVFGLHTYTEFIDQVLQISGTQYADFGVDGSLRGFYRHISVVLSNNGLNIDPLLIVLWAISVLVLIGLALWRCRHLSFDYAFSLFIVVGLLVAPLSWMSYHPALMLPAVVLVYHRNWLPVLYIAVLWLSVEHFIPAGTFLNFNTIPILFGSLLTTALLGLYFGFLRGPIRKAVKGNMDKEQDFAKTGKAY